MTLVYLALCACYIFPAYAKTSTELQYVQILYRHGDRAPIELYPTDPNLHYNWPDGLANLTPLGMRQHYAHGKFLRKMYADFITTNPREINVLTSEADRCMKSAECNLATFYAPLGQWKFENNVNWQPITMHYKPIAEDKYLEASSYCPRADEEEQNVYNSPGGQKIIKENWEMFQNLSISAGKNITTWKTASYLFDVLMIEKYYNLTIPSWANAYWNQLDKVHNLSFYWNFNSPMLLRLRAGPLLGLIIEKMENKIRNKSFTEKVQVYSAHDSNIAVLLHALNLFNMLPPPYCSTLLFELHKVNEDYAIRLLYLNSSTPEKGDQVPHLLILDGCTEFCPLQYWKTYTKHLIPENWEQECGISNAEPCEACPRENFAITWFLAALSIVLIAGYLYLLWKDRQRQIEREEYFYHLMPNT